jgi:two-component system chemotaxis response regulator CheB
MSTAPTNFSPFHADDTPDHDDFGLNQSKIMNVIDSDNLERERQMSLRNLRELDGAGKIAQRPTFPNPAQAPTARSALPPYTQSSALRGAIVIGASTGGPQALDVVLDGLRPVLQHVPIFVVQHIPSEFTDVIAEHIHKSTGLPARAARQGETVQNGQIYLSPGNLHLVIARVGDSVVTVLGDQPPENFCKPSVDVLFRSAARCYGAGVIGIMLTGMGRDGLAGSRAIVEAGGKVVAQDAASSTVWGMPGAVVNDGLAHAVLPVGRIAANVCALLNAPRFVHEKPL